MKYILDTIYYDECHRLCVWCTTGLSGGTLSDIAIEYWSLHLDKGLDRLIAIDVMFINVAVTILQHDDNFANLGGLIIGILIGFVIFTCLRSEFGDHGAVTLIVFLTHIGVASTKELIVKVLNLEILCT
ncbi:hypothetical protein QL285_079985 [Trifolium repens]|nr:hypothetical protein QL285_079985 [Trifolium repens]